MIRLYRIIKFFFIYRKKLLKNRKYLQDKYGFDINLFFEFYTTITLVDAPEEIKQQLGRAFAEAEIKKFINLVINDLPKIELDELVNVYEIKKIDDDNYGIAFGYSLMNNRTLILSLLGIIISLITVGIILI